MKHLIIGTAGHVDHGKTMLVKALTGVDTDRLREEKERGISIELGFASLTLPSGRQAAIIDVPGHERFIKNMLAGSSGIDIVLLIIAADEGVMPQTREHLDIIELLQVNKGIIVITKVDLVDQDWLDLVEEEVKEYLSTTVLKDAPLIKVSAATGENINSLLTEIDRLAGEVQEKSAAGKPRLPIDRVFSVTGFGTVVTGTLISGRLKLGDGVELYPDGLVSRVRSLQVHGKSTEAARAGQRVAVNLTGLEVEQVKRGDILTLINSLTPSHRLDVRMLLLKNTGSPLKHRARVRLYIGTAEVLARVIFFDREELQPSDWAYAQLQLEEPIATAKGDRFVIRSYSPMHTIGGGLVIDATAKKHKRSQKDLVERLATLEKGTPVELIEQYLGGYKKPVSLAELRQAVSISMEQVQAAVKELSKTYRIKVINMESTQYLISEDYYKKLTQEIKTLLKEYHREFPLREGYPKEELRSRRFKDINTKLFQALLQQLETDGVIRIQPQTISSPDFVSGPEGELSAKVQKVENAFLKAEFQPPGWTQVVDSLKINENLQQELLQFLIRKGTLIKIAEDIYFHRKILDKGVKLLAAYFKEHPEITIGEARTLMATSRKYALPLLEYFDRRRYTRRVGDLRVAGKALEV